MQPLMRWQSVVLVVVGGALAALLVALTLGGGEELALLGTGGVGARVASKSEATTPAPAVGRVTAMTRGARLVPGHSTRFSDTYQRRDGSLVTKVFSRPVNVRDGRGTWRPIDPRLVVRGAGFAARRAPLAVALPRRLGAGVQVGAGRDRMSMRLLGADGTAVVRGARARYSDVLPRVTAIYDSQGSRLREQLVLADRRAPARLRFALSASAGLRARQTRSGDVIFTRRGRAVFTLPASYALRAEP